jgi:hypothetical protein
MVRRQFRRSPESFQVQVQLEVQRSAAALLCILLSYAHHLAILTMEATMSYAKAVSSGSQSHPPAASPPTTPPLKSQYGAEGTFGIRWDRNGRPKAYKKPPVMGEGDSLGAGDSHLVLDILPSELAEGAFEKMRTEVAWNTMHHRGMIF